MARWTHNIDFHRKLSEFNSEYDPDNELEEVPVIGKKMAEWVKTLPPEVMFPVGYIKRFESVKTEAQFNHVISDVYDWADANKIWLGLPL